MFKIVIELIESYHVGSGENAFIRIKIKVYHCIMYLKL